MLSITHGDERVNSTKRKRKAETDEVVVTASYIDRNLSEIENPLHLVGWR